MKFPVLLSNQYAPSAICPAGRIALRSFNDTPITFDLPLPYIFISSPSVLTSMRRVDAPPSPAPPSIFTELSETLETWPPESRSYHSLATMPLIDGVAPDINVLWPIAVTVGKCSYRAFANTAPLVSRVLKPPEYESLNRIR